MKIDAPVSEPIKVVQLDPTPTQPVVQLHSTKPKQVIHKQISIAPSDLDPLFQKYFGTNWHSAKAIANCESGLHPDHINNNPRTGDYSVGLFQINLFGKLAKHRPSADWLLNAENNMSYAAQMSNGGRNWHAWTCARKLGL